MHSGLLVTSDEHRRVGELFLELDFVGVETVWRWRICVEY